ncbi:hypothetical protein Ciccas_009275 [Cichlidogyrus casuarinus]|uniref:Dynein light chain n=1 Tax=Cichlidogyrus casuarinus TaxID=1844966 RepID=A0ABD2PXI0_9PLAT
MPAVQEITINSCDMDDDEHLYAIEYIQKVMQSKEDEHALASKIKEEFDKRFGAAWHCFIGYNFGSYISHESGHFIHMNIADRTVLLFKAGCPLTKM